MKNTLDKITFPYSNTSMELFDWDWQKFFLNSKALEENLLGKYSEESLIEAVSMIRFKELYQFEGLWKGHIGYLHNPKLREKLYGL